MASTRTRTLTFGLFSASLVVGLVTGCVTINTGTPQPSPTATETVLATAPVASEVPKVDDSAALSALAMTPGALFAMIKDPTAESCNYVAFMQPQLDAATPAESYRGRYEQVSSKMGLAAQLCGTVEGQDMAQQARAIAVALLNELEVLGIKWV